MLRPLLQQDERAAERSAPCDAITKRNPRTQDTVKLGLLWIPSSISYLPRRSLHPSQPLLLILCSSCCLCPKLFLSSYHLQKYALVFWWSPLWSTDLVSLSVRLCRNFSPKHLRIPSYPNPNLRSSFPFTPNLPLKPALNPCCSSSFVSLLTSFFLLVNHSWPFRVHARRWSCMLHGPTSLHHACQWESGNRRNMQAQRGEKKWGSGFTCFPL